MTRIRFSIVFLCLITFLSSIAYPASLTGTIYDEGINPISGATVSLKNGQMLYSQVITNQSGEYDISCPAGEYELTASMNKDSQMLKTSVALNLSENDSFHIDLILMPEFGVSVPEIVTIPEEQNFTTPLPSEQNGSLTWIIIGFGVVLIAVAIIITYFVWKKQTEGIKKEIQEIKLNKQEPPLGRFLTDEEKVYQIILKHREIPQKHIVTQTEFSKAKVTMILKKLEKLGKIKRTSTGREKIIKPVE
jgi:uncharacterized membrane protein